MATKEEIITMARTAIEEYDDEMAEEAAAEALAAGIDPIEVIEEGFTVAMNAAGEKFEAGELFLPHLIAASEAMTAGINVLTPAIEAAGEKTESIGTVALGTIEGDIHSIGKDIVATMLKIAGFKINDLGRDVAIASYIEAAKDADVVASSALMTTTMVLQIQIEEQLKEAGLRDSVKTMVGGAPVTQDWADKIGADIYAENANDAVVKLKALFA
ncbi:methyltransferase cognate corrinoid protein [Methanococcoides sp. FTZ1]|uniref:methyltransferase cognate corrinoid protein n=1 Tax=Methanococcoides sp. FTZ1 TaxID=3439061 RepID=UPI003F852CCF